MRRQMLPIGACRFGRVHRPQIPGGALQHRQPFPPLGTLVLVLIAMMDQMQYRVDCQDFLVVHDAGGREGEEDGERSFDRGPHMPIPV